MENPETTSLLLLYLAGELPARQRGELEAKLAGDPPLRAELEALRLADAQVRRAVGALDESQPPPISQGAAVRDAVRAMRQWKVDRLAQPGGSAATRRARFGWTYAVASAVAVLIIAGFAMWSRVNDRYDKPAPEALAMNAGQQSDDMALSATSEPATGVQPSPAPVSGVAMAPSGDSDLTPPAPESGTALANALTDFGGGRLLDENADSLTSAERQLDALKYLAERTPDREDAVSR